MQIEDVFHIETFFNDVLMRAFSNEGTNFQGDHLDTEILSYEEDLLVQRNLHMITMKCGYKLAYV